jgi:hypothetical protein
MPPRRKTVTHRQFQVTTEVQRLRTVAGWEAYWGGRAAGRRAWEALGHRLVRSGPFRPELWWAYTPRVPKALRQKLERADPRWLLGGGPAPPGYYDQDRAYTAHRLARLEWLIKSGHLEPDEVERARGHVSAIRRDGPVSPPAQDY